MRELMGFNCLVFCIFIVFVQHGCLALQQQGSSPCRERQSYLKYRRNKVQFRDSTGKIIATLQDPQNPNDANVTLSKGDDFKRFIDEISHAGLIDRRTQAIITKRNALERYIKKLKEEAVHSKKDISPKRLSGKHKVTVKKKKKDFSKERHKNFFQNIDLALMTHKLKTVKEQAKKISQLHEDVNLSELPVEPIKDPPYSAKSPADVPELSVVPFDWKKLLNVDDIADTVKFEKADQPCDSVKPAEPGANAHDGRERYDKLRGHHKQKREMSDIENTIDDIISFYKELDNLKDEKDAINKRSKIKKSKNERKNKRILIPTTQAKMFLKRILHDKSAILNTLLTARPSLKSKQGLAFKRSRDYVSDDLDAIVNTLSEPTKKQVFSKRNKSNKTETPFSRTLESKRKALNDTNRQTFVNSTVAVDMEKDKTSEINKTANDFVTVGGDDEAHQINSSDSEQVKVDHNNESYKFTNQTNKGGERSLGAPIQHLSNTSQSEDALPNTNQSKETSSNANKLKETSTNIDQSKKTSLITDQSMKTLSNTDQSKEISSYANQSIKTLTSTEKLRESIKKSNQSEETSPTTNQSQDRSKETNQIKKPSTHTNQSNNTSTSNDLDDDFITVRGSDIHSPDPKVKPIENTTTPLKVSSPKRHISINLNIRTSNSNAETGASLEEQVVRQLHNSSSRFYRPTQTPVTNMDGFIKIPITKTSVNMPSEKKTSQQSTGNQEIKITPQELTDSLKSALRDFAKELKKQGGSNTIIKREEQSTPPIKMKESENFSLVTHSTIVPNRYRENELNVDKKDQTSQLLKRNPMTSSKRAGMARKKCGMDPCDDDDTDVELLEMAKQNLLQSQMPYLPQEDLGNSLVGQQPQPYPQSVSNPLGVQQPSQIIANNYPGAASQQQAAYSAAMQQQNAASQFEKSSDTTESQLELIEEAEKEILRKKKRKACSMPSCKCQQFPCSCNQPMCPCDNSCFCMIPPCFCACLENPHQISMGMSIYPMTSYNPEQSCICQFGTTDCSCNPYGFGQQQNQNFGAMTPMAGGCMLPYCNPYQQQQQFQQQIPVQPSFNCQQCCNEEDLDDPCFKPCKCRRRRRPTPLISKTPLLPPAEQAPPMIVVPTPPAAPVPPVIIRQPRPPPPIVIPPPPITAQAPPIAMPGQAPAQQPLIIRRNRRKRKRKKIIVMKQGDPYAAQGMQPPPPPMISAQPPPPPMIAAQPPPPPMFPASSPMYMQPQQAPPPYSAQGYMAQLLEQRRRRKRRRRRRRRRRKPRIRYMQGYQRDEMVSSSTNNNDAATVKELLTKVTNKALMAGIPMNHTLEEKLTEVVAEAIEKGQLQNNNKRQTSLISQRHLITFPSKASKHHHAKTAQNHTIASWTVNDRSQIIKSDNNDVIKTQHIKKQSKKIKEKTSHFVHKHHHPLHSPAKQWDHFTFPPKNENKKAELQNKINTSSNHVMNNLLFEIIRQSNSADKENTMKYESRAEIAEGGNKAILYGIKPIKKYLWTNEPTLPSSRSGFSSLPFLESKSNKEKTKVRKKAQKKP